MALTKVPDFLDALKTLHLLEPPQLSKVLEQQAKIPDPQTLAKELVKRGWLTLFQAKMVFAGKGAELLLGSYVLLDRLGEGGMGEVYKAKNWKMGRVVALKIIRKDKLRDDNALRRFLREVKAAAQLSHPNIIQALDADQVNNTHFFAMEYVEGTDLSKLVKQSGPLPVALACDYIRQAALGLQHAHEKGMVHRDIKPSNLLVAADGTVKLLDMGLARMNETDENTTTLTMEGSVLGTIDYLSPEQALNARKADIRSDLYSLGCTFYYILTGQVPFPGGNATEKLLKHRLEEPEPVEKLRPDVPPPVAAVVRKLMAREPDNRYQTPAEVVAALSAGIGRLPVGAGMKAVPGNGPDAPTIAGVGPDTLKGWPRLRRMRDGKKRWLVLGIGTGALGLLGLCCLGMMSGSGSGSGAGSATASEQSTLVGKAVAATKTVPKELRYVKQETWEATLLATLEANGLPTLKGQWYYIGYFENPFGQGFQTQFPPEIEINLTKTYKGRDGTVGWKEFEKFHIGRPNPLNVLPNPGGSTIYLYHEVVVPEAVELPLLVGGKNAVRIWLNEEQVFERVGPFGGHFSLNLEKAPSLKLKTGRNKLLVKVCNLFGDYWIRLLPGWPPKLVRLFGDTLRRDFPRDPER